MRFTIGIQHDENTHKNEERQSFSERWHELAKKQDINSLQLDVYSSDILKQLRQCDGFMWRVPPEFAPRGYAKKLIPSIERGLNIQLFPNSKTLFHHEDKIVQHYLLNLANIPTPLTHIFYNQNKALEYCRNAKYPFVVKLSAGYQGNNVYLVRTKWEAIYFIGDLFGPGLKSFGYKPASVARKYLRRMKTALEVVKGNAPNSPTWYKAIEHGYFYIQEFLPGNEFDTRVAVIGNRAFAFRRFNRTNDFRASGSGFIDWDQEKIDKKFIRLAFYVAQKLDVQLVGIDGLYREDEPVVGELTFSFASWAVRDCPGHWICVGDPFSGELKWKEGSMRPEDAIFYDFISNFQK